MRPARQTASEPDPDERSWVYRLVLGGTMLPLLLLFAAGFYYRIKDDWKIEEDTKTPILDRIFEMISWEAHIAFFMASLIAVVWSISTPKRIYRAMDRAFDKALTFALWMIILAVIYGWLS